MTRTQRQNQTLGSLFFGRHFAPLLFCYFSKYKKNCTTMKKYLLAFSLLSIFIISHATKLETFFNDTDAFMKKYVKNGLVNYSAVKANKTDIQNLVTQIETMSVGKSANARAEAFYINSYNVLVINAIAKQYPVKSPMDIDGFFDKKKHKIADEYLTLNDIENIKLRKEYSDARLHFVLVCAAKGCPKITNFAYEPDKLDAQLETQTKKALNDPNFIRVKTSSKLVLISEIFKWYKDDFISTNNHQDFITFLNKYRSEKISNALKVDFYPYNWQLNAL